MKAILVRIGIDHAYGGWNAPMSLVTKEFVYVPIPENRKFQLRKGMDRNYGEVTVPIADFCSRHNISIQDDLRYPAEKLDHSSMHLDPDFEFLTYGDNGAKRGMRIAKLSRGDLLVFYAGLRPIEELKGRLTYAIVGIFLVNEVVKAVDVEPSRMYENAHTRKVEISTNDIVVRANSQESGRLTHCIPIGEYRDRAYRVERAILDHWGGLSVRKGYIQRSAVPPQFLDPPKFRDWFQSQNPMIERRNF